MHDASLDPDEADAGRAWRPLPGFSDNRQAVANPIEAISLRDASAGSYPYTRHPTTLGSVEHATDKLFAIDCPLCALTRYE